MGLNYADQVMAVAKMEDTLDLLSHIAWTDTIKPELEKQVRVYSEMLVNDALGVPLPEGLTREKIAGMCYGISWISKFLDRVLRDGEKAVKDLHLSGFTL